MSSGRTDRKRVGRASSPKEKWQGVGGRELIRLATLSPVKSAAAKGGHHVSNRLALGLIAGFIASKSFVEVSVCMPRSKLWQIPSR
jgi:hypothetical protein